MKNSQTETSSRILQTEQIKHIRETLIDYRSYAQVLRQSQSEKNAGSGSLLSSAIEPYMATWMHQMDEVGLPIEEIRIQDRFLRWTPEWMELVRDLCLHAVNNSLDHGFAFPFRRGTCANRKIFHLRTPNRLRKSCFWMGSRPQLKSV